MYEDHEEKKNHLVHNDSHTSRRALRQAVPAVTDDRRKVDSLPTDKGLECLDFQKIKVSPFLKDDLSVAHLGGVEVKEGPGCLLSVVLARVSDNSYFDLFLFLNAVYVRLDQQFVHRTICRRRVVGYLPENFKPEHLKFIKNTSTPTQISVSLAVICSLS